MSRATLRVMHQPPLPDSPEKDNEPASPIPERDTAKRIGMSLAFTRHERRHGRGPAHLRLGRSIRYWPKDIDAWLEARTVRADSTTVPEPEPQ